MAVLFNETIRCYEDGKVERFSYNKWFEVINTAITGGYNTISINGKKIYRHRLIAACFLGLNIDDPTQTVDHINRDRLDNRVDNLRIVTLHQQKFNKGEPKGCTWHKRANKWQSTIQLNGKCIYLGLFNTEAEAHQAYLEAKAEYHII